MCGRSQLASRQHVDAVVDHLSRDARGNDLLNPVQSVPSRAPRLHHQKRVQLAARQQELLAHEALMPEYHLVNRRRGEVVAELRDVLQNAQAVRHVLPEQAGAGGGRESAVGLGLEGGAAALVADVRAHHGEEGGCVGDVGAVRGADALLDRRDGGQVQLREPAQQSDLDALRARAERVRAKLVLEGRERVSERGQASVKKRSSKTTRTHV